MAHRITLLLNVAVLGVTFFLALGASETQNRVLRTTARVAFAPPVPRPAPPPRIVRGAARLDRYLSRLAELDRLTAPQVDALYGALLECEAELQRDAEAARTAHVDGARTRRLLDAARERAAGRVERRLAAAGVPVGKLRERLVHIVLICSG